MLFKNPFYTSWSASSEGDMKDRKIEKQPTMSPSPLEASRLKQADSG